MRIVSIIGIVLILGVTLVFSGLNANSVTVKYIFGEAELPLVVLMVLNLLLGMLLCYFVMIWKVIKHKSTIRSLKSQLKKAEAQHNPHQAAIKEM